MLVFAPRRTGTQRTRDFIALASLTVVIGFALGPRVHNKFVRSQLAGHIAYDEHLDGPTELARSLEQANATNKRLIVVFGGNWCEWCLALDALLHTDKEIRTLLAERFVLLKLDANSNDEFDKAWGHPRRFGVPVLLLMNRQGKPDKVQEAAALETWGGRLLRFDRTRVLSLLKSWL